MIRASSPPSAPPALACLARAGAREGWAGTVRVREGGFSFSIWLSVSCAISAPLGYFLSSFCVLFILSLCLSLSLSLSPLFISLSLFSLFRGSLSLCPFLLLYFPVPKTARGTNPASRHYSQIYEGPNKILFQFFQYTLTFFPTVCKSMTVFTIFSSAFKKRNKSSAQKI